MLNPFFNFNLDNQELLLLESYYYFLYSSSLLNQAYIQPKFQGQAIANIEPNQPVYINTKSDFNFNLNFTNDYNQNQQNFSMNTPSSMQVNNTGMKRALMKISKCPHISQRHYAKGMCSNCYHSKGRTKHPWRCSHISKPLYAKGLCQNCYQFNYLKVNYY